MLTWLKNYLIFISITLQIALSSKRRLIIRDWHTLKKKRGATLSLVPRSIGLRIALLVRNEQRWKPHADVLYIYAIKGIGKTTNTKEGCIKYIPWDVPAALFLTSIRMCEVPTRQNQSVQLRLFMYMCHDPPLPIGAFSKSMTMQN